MLACSIILDARSSGAGLPRHMATLRPLVDKPDCLNELVLVDNTHDPRFPDLAERHLARRLVCDSILLGERLNLAVTHSQGELLVFPAPRLPPTEAWLSRAASAMQHNESDAVTLSRRPGNFRLYIWQQLRPGSPSSTLCLSRKWFERIGGCDPRLDKNALPDLLGRLRACQARVTHLNT